MRTQLALAATATILLVAGCNDRVNLRELPDDQGHAAKFGGADRPANNSPIPYGDEILYTVVGGETLKTLARKFGTSERHLIERNDLERETLSPGQSLVVPKPASK